VERSLPISSTKVAYALVVPEKRESPATYAIRATFAGAAAAPTRRAPPVTHVSAAARSAIAHKRAIIQSPLQRGALESASSTYGCFMTPN
jgi:hypothetical protein